jgi:malonyl-CoA O-methyltransferase
MNDSPASRDMFPPDPVASTRWQTRPGFVIPPSVLHAQVAKNMALRLRALKQPPRLCLDWQPSVGAVLAQDALKAEGFDAACQIHEPHAQRFDALRRHHAKPWWHWGQRLQPASRTDGFDLVWSNLGLHLAHDPAAWLARWHQALIPDGCVVFSCFGPDTLRELQTVYALGSWPYPCQDWMDMHDWGDVLLKNGWKDPVMDVERFVLTYQSPDAVIRDLRDWGRNLHPRRFAACRSRSWLLALKQGLTRSMSESSDGQFKLTFEIVHGHAMRGEDRRSSHHVQSIPLSSMKSQLSSKGK